MIEIKDLLAKFNNILISKEGKKESVRNAISETIRVEIKKEDIEIKNNIVYLNIKPIYKSEILLKQEEIFLRLKKSLGGKTPEAIR